jgi:uncharacterized membrane protein
MQVNETVYQAVVALAGFLCSLVAGFLFAFAAVVMPGIGKLDDGAFIRAFQSIDGVIQRNGPLFVLVWVGSVLAVIAAAVLAVWAPSGPNRLLTIAAALVYVVGVQIPTVGINVPLNNALQKLDPGSMDERARRRAREDFESRWNRWNVFRTVCASVVSILFILLLVMED